LANLSSKYIVYKRENIQYCAHPNYHRRGPWHDWVMVKTIISVLSVISSSTAGNSDLDPHSGYGWVIYSGCSKFLLVAVVWACVNVLQSSFGCHVSLIYPLVSLLCSSWWCGCDSWLSIGKCNKYILPWLVLGWYLLSFSWGWDLVVCCR